MKLTSKGRYAVTAMLDLALHTNEGPIALSDISSRQDLSLSYLEQLFTRLRKHELVYSTRGPGGGYTLCKSAYEIAVADVIEAVNETVDITQCGGKADCKDGDRCLTHDLWSELGNQIQTFLSGVTLGQLIDQESDRRQVSVAQPSLSRAKTQGAV